VALDLSDPLGPSELGSIDLVEAQHLVVVADLAFVATTDMHGNGRIDVIDVGDPTRLEHLAELTRPGPSPTIFDIDANDTISVVADADGLLVIDVDDPSRPVVVDRWLGGGFQVKDVATAWPSIVVSHEQPGLTVLGLDRSCLPPRRVSDRVTP
jgi:hypothetical protein